MLSPFVGNPPDFIVLPAKLFVFIFVVKAIFVSFL